MADIWWDFIHNCVVHPALFFSGHRKCVERLHDWTYQKAWGTKK